MLRWARLLVALTAGALLCLLSAGPAWAHANLIDTDPADGSVVADSPKDITVTFNEPVSLTPQGSQLLDATGEPIDAQVNAIDNTVIFTPPEPLADGTYIVSWRITSADTHVIAGGISFSVGAPSSTSIDLEIQEGDRQVNVIRITAEAVRYGGVLGLAGLGWFALFAAPSSMRRSATYARRVRRTTSWLAAAAIGGAVALIPLVKAWQDGVSLAGVLSPSLWAAAITEPTAVAAAPLIIGVIWAGVAARRNLPELTMVGLALALGSLIVVGHTRVFGPAWLVVPADLLHVATAALWLGGLIGLCLLLLPDPLLRRREVAQTVGYFSGAALWFVIALSTAAIVLWWRIAGNPLGLFTSTYGISVLIKASIVLLLLAIAAWNRYRLVPAVLADTARPASLTRLRRTVGIEIAALVVVIAATGLLSTVSPPEPTATTETATTDTQSLTASAGGVIADIELVPGQRGTNALQLTLSDTDGAPLDTYETPTLSVKFDEADLGPFSHPLSATGPGTFEANVDFPLPGTWTITLAVRVSQFDSPILTTTVEIA